MIERRVGTESEGVHPFSAAGWQLLNDALETVLNGDEPEAFIALERDGEAQALVVVRNAAHLVWLHTTGPTASLFFLGQLRGVYTETLRLVDTGLRVDYRLDHTADHLASPLELTIEPFAPHAHVQASTRNRQEQIGKLRGKLREWASVPAPTLTR